MALSDCKSDIRNPWKVTFWPLTAFLTTFLFLELYFFFSFVYNAFFKNERITQSNTIRVICLCAQLVTLYTLISTFIVTHVIFTSYNVQQDTSKFFLSLTYMYFCTTSYIKEKKTKKKPVKFCFCIYFICGWHHWFNWPIFASSYTIFYLFFYYRIKLTFHNSMLSL